MTTMIMIFQCAGFDSEEQYDVLEIQHNIVTLNTDDDPSKCKQFNLTTGKCLNDDTSFGASRRLKL